MDLSKIICFRKYETNNYNMDSSKIICFRKYEVSDERISVCNFIENLVEHGIHCLPCSFINYKIVILS